MCKLLYSAAKVLSVGVVGEVQESTLGTQESRTEARMVERL
jgi:hypothetical protein